jgi:hypothetical protein
MAFGTLGAGEIGSALAADVIAMVPAARRIEAKSFMSSFPFRIELDLAKPALNARETSVQISPLALGTGETNTALPLKSPGGDAIFFTKTARGSCFGTRPRVGRTLGCWLNGRNNRAA